MVYWETGEKRKFHSRMGDFLFPLLKITTAVICPLSNTIQTLMYVCGITLSKGRPAYTFRILNLVLKKANKLNLVTGDMVQARKCALP